MTANRTVGVMRGRGGPDISMRNRIEQELADKEAEGDNPYEQNTYTDTPQQHPTQSRPSSPQPQAQPQAQPQPPTQSRPASPQPQAQPQPPKNEEAAAGDTPAAHNELDSKAEINYVKGLDDIIAESYAKQKAAFEITKAVTQHFESLGVDVPFDDTRFQRLCQNIAVIEMSREIGWLFGIGAAHAEKITDHMVDQLFGVKK